jgi:hypothetical protein
MLSFACFIILQKAVFLNYKDENQEEKFITLRSPQPTTDPRIMVNNGFFRFLKNFFKNDQRNLIIYISLGTILVLLSSFIYSVLITG